MEPVGLWHRLRRARTTMLNRGTQASIALFAVHVPMSTCSLRALNEKNVGLPLAQRSRSCVADVPLQSAALNTTLSIVGTCEASRFDSNSKRPFRFDSTVMGRFENFAAAAGLPGSEWGGREGLHSAHASRVVRCSRVVPRPTCSVDSSSDGVCDRRCC